MSGIRARGIGQLDLCHFSIPVNAQCRLYPYFALPAGFLQWKALVSLLLSCEEGPLASQQDLFVSFLSVLMTQLQLGLGVPPSGGVGESVTFVDELLEDSFLKRSFGDFFEMLRDNISQAPSALVSQVWTTQCYWLTLYDTQCQPPASQLT